jgi:hypothetical protein
MISYRYLISSKAGTINLSVFQLQLNVVESAYFIMNGILFVPAWGGQSAHSRFSLCGVYASVVNLPQADTNDPGMS